MQLLVFSLGHSRAPITDNSLCLGKRVCITCLSPGRCSQVVADHRQGDTGFPDFNCLDCLLLGSLVFWECGVSWGLWMALCQLRQGGFLEGLMQSCNCELVGGWAQALLFLVETDFPSPA